MLTKIKKFFPKTRYFIDVQGHPEVTLVHKGSPITVLNSEDIELQFLYKLLSVSTDEEIETVSKRDFSKEGFEKFRKSHGEITEESNIVDKIYCIFCENIIDFDKFKPEIIKNTRKKISGVDILVADPLDIIEKYDNKDAFFPLEAIGNLEQKVETLNLGLSLEKGKFLLSTLPEGEFIDVLKEAETLDEEPSLYFYKHEGKLIVTNYELVELPETLKKWDGKVIPMVKQNKSVIMKMDFGGFENYDNLSQAIWNAIEPYRLEGYFGLVFYTEGINYPWIWICEIGEDYVIVENEDNDLYKVNIKVDNKDIEILNQPMPVKRNTIYLEEDETYEIMEKAQTKPNPENSDNNKEPEETVEKDQKEPKEQSEEIFTIKKESKLLFKSDFKIVKEEDEKFVLGVVLEPNDGVDSDLDPDTDNDVYGMKDIEKAAHRWLSDFSQIGIMHKSLAGRAIVPCESYITPVEMKIGEELIKKGTWMLGAKINDDELWELVKNNEFTGWSVGGWGAREPLN